MKLSCKRTIQESGGLVTALLLLAALPTARGEGEDGAPATHFGGPGSVGGQLKHDAERKAADPGPGLQPYYDFKDRLREKTGLTFGLDYNALLQGATDSLGEDSAGGGAFRFFGHWQWPGLDSGNSGKLVYKVENRHRLGTAIAPQDLASEVGYAGLTAITFKDAGWQLSNLYWHQGLWDNRLHFAAGILDTTDYVGATAFVNPWTDFLNQSFSTDPSIPTPGQGLGLAGLARLSDNLYVIAGLADANGDPTKPLEGFDTFFNDAEFFKSIELGWVGSWERRTEDNVHVTAWQVDARDEAGVPSGWGVAFSASRLFEDRWLPFLRCGYSDGGGGSILERSVTVGTGCYFRDRTDLLGLAANWGRPSDQTFGSGLRDQYSFEVFYRLQLLPHFAITPDIQFLVNPALSPEKNETVFGLRGRVTF